MNKQDLIDIIAKQQDTTKKEAAHIIEAFQDGVKSIMKENKSLTLVGFAKFTSELKPEHTRVLGFSGETVTIPEHYVHKAKLSPKVAE